MRGSSSSIKRKKKGFKHFFKWGSSKPEPLPASMNVQPEMRQVQQGPVVPGAALAQSPMASPDLIGADLSEPLQPPFPSYLAGQPRQRGSRKEEHDRSGSTSSSSMHSPYTNFRSSQISTAPTAASIPTSPESYQGAYSQADFVPLRTSASRVSLQPSTMLPTIDDASRSTGSPSTSKEHLGNGTAEADLTPIVHLRAATEPYYPSIPNSPIVLPSSPSPSQHALATQHKTLPPLPPKSASSSQDSHPEVSASYRSNGFETYRDSMSHRASNATYDDESIGGGTRRKAKSKVFSTINFSAFKRSSSKPVPVKEVRSN